MHMLLSNLQRRLLRDLSSGRLTAENWERRITTEEQGQAMIDLQAKGLIVFRYSIVSPAKSKLELYITSEGKAIIDEEHRAFVRITPHDIIGYIFTAVALGVSIVSLVMQIL